MNKLKPLIVVPARPQGQIGAGKVVPFTPRDEQEWIPLPKNARPSDRFDKYEISGDSLEGIGILDGFILTCRTNFNISEIKADTVCIVLILPANEQTAKMVRVDPARARITLIGASRHYKPQSYHIDDIEILAICDEIRITPDMLRALMVHKRS